MVRKRNFKKLMFRSTAVTLRVKPGQIGRGDELLLTATQISRLKKTSAAGKGMEINLSQTQIQNTAQRGGNLFSAMLRFGTTFNKASSWGISKCRFEFWS